MPDYRIVNISQIVEPELPVRATMDEQALIDLANDIRKNGLINPLTVREAGAAFEIMAGHRRFRACRLAGLVEVPSVVYKDGEAAPEAIKIAENIYREDLNPAEEAIFYQQLVEKHGWSLDDLCRATRQAPEYINSRYDLLRGDEQIFELLLAKRLSLSVARELNRINSRAAAELLHLPIEELDPQLTERIQRHRRYLAQQAAEAGATAAMIRRWRTDWQKSLVPSTPAPVAAHPSLAEPPPPPEQPRCLVCDGDTDQPNMRSVYVHWYHKDLLEKALGRIKEVLAS